MSRDETPKPLTSREVATLEFWTVADVARVLRVSPAAVAQLIDAGTLPARRYADAWRVHEDDVKRAEKGRAA